MELGFSYFNFPTPHAMLLVAAAAILFRCGELALSRQPQTLAARRTQTGPITSIAAGLIVPFALAAATKQFHTHYFGLLILPVLEAALYFSLSTTLVVATLASSSAALWVAYGWLILSRRLSLVNYLRLPRSSSYSSPWEYFVWTLLDLLGKQDREAQGCGSTILKQHGSGWCKRRSWPRSGVWQAQWLMRLRNPVAIISSAMEAARSVSLTAEEREDMSSIALTEAKRLERLTTDFLSYGTKPGDLPRNEIDVFTLVGYIASIAKAQALGKSVFHLSQ